MGRRRRARQCRFAGEPQRRSGYCGSETTESGRRSPNVRTSISTSDGIAASTKRPTRAPMGRPVLGRKGIGKFAGFGIAGVLEIDTTSARTGERTIFRLDLQDLRSDSYVGTNAKEVPVLLREPESEARKAQRGTSVTMKRLTVGRTPSRSVFRTSMARRFLINQVADTFEIRINSEEVPDDNALMGVEFDFPEDYRDEERPSGLRIKDSVGYEIIGDEEISWRIRFTKETIGTERTSWNFGLLRHQASAIAILLQSVGRVVRSAWTTIRIRAGAGRLSG